MTPSYHLLILGQSRARRRVYIQHTSEKDSGIKEREGKSCFEL
jgi:hypothetical protein